MGRNDAFPHLWKRRHAAGHAGERAFPNSEYALPDVSQDAFGGADQVGTAGLVGGEGDNDGRGEGQGHGTGDRRPAGEGGTLPEEDAEETAKEALDGRALAEFRGRPGRGETGEVLGGLGVEGDDGDG